MFSHPTSQRPPLEELIIYALLMITGAIPVISACGSGRFGVEATIGGIMVGAGMLGVIAYAWSTARKRGAPAQSAAGEGGGGSRSR